MHDSTDKKITIFFLYPIQTLKNIRIASLLQRNKITSK